MAGRTTGTLRRRRGKGWKGRSEIFRWACSSSCSSRPTDHQQGTSTGHVVSHDEMRNFRALELCDRVVSTEETRNQPGRSHRRSQRGGRSKRAGVRASPRERTKRRGPNPRSTFPPFSVALAQSGRPAGRSRNRLAGLDGQTLEDAGRRWQTADCDASEMPLSSPYAKVVRVRLQIRTFPASGPPE
ncbi:hypothetical protein VTN02DRAFT_1317 [Thermoascus thermophilus]